MLTQPGCNASRCYLRSGVGPSCCRSVVLKVGHLAAASESPGTFYKCGSSVPPGILGRGSGLFSQACPPY